MVSSETKHTRSPCGPRRDAILPVHRGCVQVLDDIAYLQQGIDPAKTRQIDPYVLFACGLNTPERTDDYIGKLKTCLRL